MNDIYPRWVAAHGVMIVTPVYWYQAPSRAEADDGSAGLRRWRQSRPDHHRRQEAEEGKGARARRLGLPTAPAGRAFSVVVHGDAAGAETVRQSLHDWLTDMDLVPAGNAALNSIATSATTSPMRPATTRSIETTACKRKSKNAARTLAAAVRLARSGTFPVADRGLDEPRPK